MQFFNSAEGLGARVERGPMLEWMLELMESNGKLSSTADFSESLSQYRSDPAGSARAVEGVVGGIWS
jgi:hypothetical protein